MTKGCVHRRAQRVGRVTPWTRADFCGRRVGRSTSVIRLVADEYSQVRIDFNWMLEDNTLLTGGGLYE